MAWKGWTEEEVETLRNAWETNSRKELCAMLGRSEKSIYMKALYLGLKKKLRHKIEYNPHDLAWFKSNFPHIRTEICALKLGVSIGTASNLAKRYGLRKTPQFRAECQAYSASQMRKAKDARNNGSESNKAN